MIHASLLALVCLAIPANTKFGLQWCDHHRSVCLQVERGLKTGVAASQLMSQASPLFPWKPRLVYESFKILKAAGIGDFKYFVDDRVAAAPQASAAVR